MLTLLSYLDKSSVTITSMASTITTNTTKTQIIVQNYIPFLIWGPEESIFCHPGGNTMRKLFPQP